MATDSSSQPDKASMTVADLLAFTKSELDADAERQAKVTAGGAGELPRDAQTGVTVDLSHKNIHELPAEVIDLIKDRVERLALSHNPQITIPAQIVQCHRLRYLNLRWNQLKDFPVAVLQLSSLEILDISKNRITEIPEDIKKMTSLRFLAIARNKVTRLPLALGDMTSLSKLKFDENPIEYPPMETLQNSLYDGTDTEKEKDMCQEVKRFLKAASLRQRLKANSEEDLSESNAETPRPPRRVVTGGRFPVRPSLSGIDNIDDLRPKGSSDGVPPIPTKSHARVASGTLPPSSGGRRTGISPQVPSSADMNRSRSETVSSTASVRSRRQGFVPRKNADFSSPSDSALASMRMNQGNMKSAHSRNPSSLSTLNGFLSAGSGGESSSGAVSPTEGPASRQGPAWTGLSSLPENRNSKVRTNDAMKAAKRLHFTLVQLHRPVKDVVMALKDSTFRRSVLERHMLGAQNLIPELDRCLIRAGNNHDDSGQDVDGAMRSLNYISINILKAYVALVQELQQSTQRMVTHIDPVYLRNLMNQIYYAMVEARNICSILGFRMTTQQKSTPRASRAWSSKTVTPTQAKPINNRRMRGATILRSMNSGTSIRTMPHPPPVPLNVNDGRANLAPPLSAITPRSNDSFSTVIPSGFPSRSNTMRGDPRLNMGRSVDESDNEEQFDRIFLKTRNACEVAAASLGPCRGECIRRKEQAEAVNQTRAAYHWGLAVQKCDAMISANQMLFNRLKMVKLKDPGVRHQRDFWLLCDTFVHSFTALADEMKALGHQRVDLASVKHLLRPVQKAVKEVSKTISESPIYQQAVRPHPPMPGGPLPQLAPPFPNGMGNSFMSQSSSGYVTPVPATPLSAALGPAAQATVASTPNLAHTPLEYYQPTGLPPVGRGQERSDTMMQHGRR